MLRPPGGTSLPVDLSEVAYVHRLVVGGVDPNVLPDQSAIDQQMDLLNRMLSERPKGRIIGMERSFAIYQVGENQVVMQAVIYHIGFQRRPDWVERLKSAEAERKKSEAMRDAAAIVAEYTSE